jgi:serine/threonine protein kinase
MVYKLGKLIGKGSDGVVYELIENSVSDKVIKFIQGDIFGIKNYIEYFIFSQLDEKYITKCYKIELNEDGLIKLIFKKADMDLKDYIQKNKLKERDKKKIMKKLLEGLEYLQSFNIIHGDIKPSNILVFPDEDIKYADFNLSSIYLKDEELNKKLYTITYRPPEILQNKATLKSDIYALGCTFFEIYYGCEYFNYSKAKKFYHIKNSSETKEENDVFNDLIKNMIHPDEKLRFSIEKIKKHEYFSKEIFPLKFNKKTILEKNQFINILKSNFPLYNIKAELDKKIFLSKTVNFSCIPIHKNYKKIESQICKSCFNFNFF